jgi:hypothetical protein
VASSSPSRSRARGGQRAAAAAHPLAFANLWEHLEAELASLDVLLETVVARARVRHQSPDGSITGWGHGLFIGDQEVDELLGSRRGKGLDQMAGRIESTLRSGIDLPLVRIATVFGLSPWERDLLLLCLAPELDRGYERIFAYLHDDATRRLPSVGLALDLVGEGAEERGRAWARLDDEAPLIRYGLIRLLASESESHRTSQPVVLDDRIRRLLLGDDTWSGRDWLRWSLPDESAEDQIALTLARHARRGSRSSPLVVSLHGPDPGRATQIARELCGELGAPLLLVDVPILVASGAPFEPTLRETARESLLRGAVLVLTGADRLSETQAEDDLRLRQLARAVEDFAWLALVIAAVPRSAPGGPWLSVEVPAASLADTAERWQRELAAAGLRLDLTETESLASRYSVGPEEIARAVRAASLQAEVKAEPLQLDHVEAACRDLATASMSGLARRIVCRYGWDDLVLPLDHVSHLRELSAAVRNRSRVMADWGFGKKVARGTGLSALFSGSPGTGKTMSAEIIAGDLGLDLYVVDLASVVSKYIGETEKNLSRIFAAAESTSAVLFFDEADALFGRRSEVKDAHDRYANIEISYLLQRIETYQGLVILATNLKRNLDEAFLRRLDFVVDFPFPDAAERKRILLAILPAGAPVAADVDWDFLASNFQLAGGNLKGVLMHAAYLAADRGAEIGMAELVMGVRRELDKMGKVSGAGDFGAYWHLVGNTG